MHFGPLFKNWIVDKLEINHGSNTPIKAMEGMRGVAVLLVFFVHYSSLSRPLLLDNTLALSIKEFIHSMGHIGVDLFFVVCGFLIYGSIISKRNFHFLTYLMRRINRIYPTFIVVLFVYLFLSFIFPSESKLPLLLKDKFIYIFQNFFLLPGIFNIPPIIKVAWTLSYEFFYYLLIPITIFGLKLTRWKSARRVFFGV